MNIIEVDKCNTCNIILDDNNWYVSLKAARHIICKECYLRVNREKHDPVKHKARMKESNKNIRIDIMEAYGGQCMCCGNNDIQHLTIDHINNDGNIARNDGKLGGYKFYQELKKQGYPKTNLQILCFNCNCSKGHIGICPHKIESYSENCFMCGCELVERNILLKNSEDRNFHPFYKKSNINVCLMCSLKMKNTINIQSKIRVLNRRYDIIQNYGRKCELCKEDKYCFLTIDHINGRQEGDEKNIGGKVYTYLKNNNYPKDNYRLLCYNCNCKLGHFNR